MCLAVFKKAGMVCAWHATNPSKQTDWKSPPKRNGALTARKLGIDLKEALRRGASAGTLRWRARVVLRAFPCLIRGREYHQAVGKPRLAAHKSPTARQRCPSLQVLFDPAVLSWPLRTQHNESQKVELHAFGPNE